MVGAIGIDQPEIGVAAIGHGIREAADVDDIFSVGRNLRIGGKLELKLVHDGQFMRRLLRAQNAWKGRDKGCDKRNQGHRESESHWWGPPRSGELTMGVHSCQGAFRKAQLFVTLEKPARDRGHSRRLPGDSTQGPEGSDRRIRCVVYCSFVYSALTFSTSGSPGSAFFHTASTSWYISRAFSLSLSAEYARAAVSCA